jgi:hypothetical protein
MSKINKTTISGPVNFHHVTHFDINDVFDTKIEPNSEKGLLLLGIPSVSRFYSEDDNTKNEDKSEAEAMLDSILKEANGDDVSKIDLTLQDLTLQHISAPISNPKQFE